MVVLPYIKDDEIWGICRIYDEDMITILKNQPMSTSPGVRLGGDDLTRRIPVGSDGNLLIEGLPKRLDHLAICDAGVWDKLGNASLGVLSTLTGDDSMTEATAKAEEEKMD